MSPQIDSDQLNIPPDIIWQLYYSMLRIRMVEEKIAEIYKEQIIRTPVHFGIGQEAAAVGVCEALQSIDVVYSHHRCHNHYLAQGGDLYSLIAELMGKEDGCSNGRGGSVHLTDRDKGFIVSSAILGQTAAVAVGSALSFKMDGIPGVAVTFFGDATFEEGVFWESINYAAIHKLPVLFVCENNGYSTESPKQVRQPEGSSLKERVESFNIAATKVDGNDAMAVYAASLEALKYCRDCKGPFFLECETYRWLEHVGPNYDHEMGRNYRSKSEVDKWIKKDPIKKQLERIQRTGDISQKTIENEKKKIQSEIEAAVQRAKQAPWPKQTHLFNNVYGT